MKIFRLVTIFIVSILIGQYTILNAQSWQSLVDSTKYYYGKHDYKTSIIWGQKALNQAEKEFGKNDTNYINTLEFIITSYSFQFDYNNAIKYTKIDSSLIFDYYGEKSPVYIDLLNTLGIFYYDIKNYRESINTFEKSLTITKKYNMIPWSGIYNHIGRIYEYLADYDSAEYYKKFGLELAKNETGDTSLNYAENLFSLARFFMQTQRNDPIPLLITANLIFIKNKNANDQFNTLDLLGTCYINIGKIDSAEYYIKNALDLAKLKYGDNDYKFSHYLNNMGYFYYNTLNDFNNAETYYLKALNIRKKYMDSLNNDNIAEEYYITLSNLAILYRETGRFAERDSLLSLVLEFNKKTYGEISVQYAFALSNSASSSEDLKNLDKAEILYKKSINIYKELLKDEYNNAYSNLLNNLGQFYKKTKKYDLADSLLSKVLEIRKKICVPDNPELAMSYINLAGLYFDLKRYDKAESLFIEALKLFKKNIMNTFSILSEKESAQYWNMYKNSFEMFNSFAINRMNGNPYILCNMYDNRLFTKELLFSSTSKIKRRIMNSNNDSLISNYKNWVTLKALLLNLSSYTNEQLIEENTNKDSIQMVADNLEKKLKAKSELLAESFEKKNISWRNIQSILKPDEAAIEIIRFELYDKDWIDSIYYAVLIITEQNNEHPDIVIFENGKELETFSYNLYRNNINNKIEDKESYYNFWSKIDEKLKGVKKIYFAPDGIYNKINPATLLKPNGKYILEDQVIQIVNSTKDILTNLYRNQEESYILNSAELFGNPNFYLNNKKQLEIENKYKLINDDNFSLIRKDSLRGTNIAELPGTEDEVKNIEKFLISKKWVVNSYLGDNAVKSAVKSINSPRVLHIATHGIYLENLENNRIEGNPLLRSGLLFSGSGNYIKNSSKLSSNQENGILTSFEAMNLNLDHTELVVLSACETGLGVILNGDGVYGLQRAFQQAGAKSVIMSLWSVNDKTTQELMSSFYKNWVSGMTKRVAFSKAQQEIKNKYKAPYYWGAFVMVGE